MKLFSLRSHRSIAAQFTAAHKTARRIADPVERCLETSKLDGQLRSYMDDARNYHEDKRAQSFYGHLRRGVGIGGFIAVCVLPTPAGIPFLIGVGSKFLFGGLAGGILTGFAGNLLENKRLKNIFNKFGPRLSKTFQYDIPRRHHRAFAKIQNLAQATQNDVRQDLQNHFNKIALSDKLPAIFSTSADMSVIEMDYMNALQDVRLKNGLSYEPVTTFVRKQTQGLSA